MDLFTSTFAIATTISLEEGSTSANNLHEHAKTRVKTAIASYIDAHVGPYAELKVGRFFF